MKILAIDVPYDSGHLRERMGLGPAALLKAGLIDRLRFLGHEIATERLRIAEDFPCEIKTTFAVARNLSEQVSSAREEGYLPLVFSGNCDAALGTISGLSPSRTGVLWFDAHGEFHTPETTVSGFLDGMGLAIATGYCWRNMAESIPGFTRLSPDTVILAGVRDTEPAEQQLLDGSGVQQIPARRVLEQGMRALLVPALSILKEKIERIYLHFDLDVLDPSTARWNEWTPAAGLTIEQLEEAIALLADGPPIAAVGFASHHPSIDPEGSYEVARRLVDSILAVVRA